MLQPVAPLEWRKVVGDDAAAAAAQVAPRPSRGCGSTVALLRCRLQTNLSPTNHDLADLPLNLGADIECLLLGVDSLCPNNLKMIQQPLSFKVISCDCG